MIHCARWNGTYTQRLKCLRERWVGLACDRDPRNRDSFAGSTGKFWRIGNQGIYENLKKRKSKPHSVMGENQGFRFRLFWVQIRTSMFFDIMWHEKVYFTFKCPSFEKRKKLVLPWKSLERIKCDLVRKALRTVSST